MDEGLDVGVGVDHVADLVRVARARSFAHEQTLGLDSENHGHHDEQHTDGESADRIPGAVAGEDSEPHAEHGEDQTGECCDVFEQHDGKLGRLGVADE